MAKVYDHTQGVWVEIPDEQVRDRYLAGEIGFADGQEVPFYDRDTGALVTVDAADAAQAFRYGHALAPQAELDRAIRWEGRDSAWKAGAIAAADSLSLGGLTYAAGAIGGDKTREAMVDYLERSPNARALGTLLGAAAPLLVTGGTSAAAQGGVAATRAGALGKALALSPAGLATRAGTIAEHAVARAVGTEGASLATRALKGAAPLAAQGAVEAAAFGAGARVTETVLDLDHELTAQRAIAAAFSPGRVAEDVLLGGGLGGVLGATPVLGRETIQYIGSKMPTREGMIGLSAKVSGVDEELLQKFLAKGPEGKQARETAVYGFKQAEEKAIRDVASLDTEAEHALNALTKGTVKGQKKLKNIETIVKAGNEAEVAEKAVDILGNLQGRIERMSADPGTYSEMNLKSANETLHSAFEKIAKIFNKGDDHVNAKVFMVLDDVKRELGTWSNAGHLITSGKEGANYQAFRSMYGDLQKMLEHEATWGEAALVQARVNAKWSPEIDASKRAGMQTRTGKDGFDPVFGTDPRAVKRDLIKRLDDPSGDFKKEFVREHIEARRELAEVIAESFELTAEELQHVERIKASTARLESVINEAEKNAQLMTEYKRIFEHQSNAPLGGFGTAFALGGGALNWLFGDEVDVKTLGGAMAIGRGIGSGAGMLLRGLQRPGAAIQRLAYFERLNERYLNKTSSGLREFFSGVKAKGKAAAGHIPAAVQWLTREGETKEQTFKRKTTQLRGQDTSLEATVERHAKLIQGLQQAPHLTMQMQMTSMRASEFLKSKLPVPEKSSRPSLTPHLDEEHISPTEMAKFARYAAVVEAPLSVLEDLEHRTLTGEAVETLQVVYPKVLEDIRKQVLDELAVREAPLPYQDRMQLGMLLGAPGDGTLTPEFVSAVQAAYAPKESPATDSSPVNGGAPEREIRLAGRARTTVQTMEHG